MGSIRGCFYALLSLVVVGASCSASDVAEVHEPAAVPLSVVVEDSTVSEALAVEVVVAADESIEQEELGLERDTQRCSGSFWTEPDFDGKIPISDAVELVRGVLADRASGARAQLCLTDDGLRSFSSISADPADSARHEPSCLFACEDGQSPVFEAALVANHFNWTGMDVPESVSTVEVVMARVDPMGMVTTVREYYQVVAVEGFGGQTEARIQAIWTEVDSYVDYDRGVEFLTTFLQDLAAERYDVACCVYNEGTSEQILAQLGEDWEVPLAQKFESYCQTAYCIAEFQIVDQASSTQSSRDYVVRFDTVDGPFTVRIGVSTWEGRYTVNSMPPSQWIADEGERTDQCGC